MIIYPFDPICSVIVESLAEKQALSVKELKTMLDSSNVQCSLQHLYRELANLSELQVLTKIKRKYSLNPLWVSSMREISEAAIVQFGSKNTELLGSAMNMGEKREFIAEDFVSICSIADHIILSIVSQSEVDHVYQYRPHMYWWLRRLEPNQFYQSVQKFGADITTVIGNDTFLDRYCVDLAKDSQPNRRIAICDTTTFDSKKVILEVIGPYVLKRTIPDTLVSTLDLFFETIDSIENFDQQLYRSCFTAKHQCSLSVIRDQAVADTTRRAIESYVPTSD